MLSVPQKCDVLSITSYNKFVKKMIICITIYFYINYNPYTTTISYSLLQYLLTANAHFAYAK